MKNKLKRVVELFNKRELSLLLKQKYKRIFWVKNSTIRNIQIKDEVYRKFKRKYSKVLVNFKSAELKKSNKVWVCWLQGEENAPLLVKKCIQSIRENIGDREFILITLDNYKEYIEFPDYILEKFEKKIIPYAQFSDLIRISLIAKYGGLWLDATVLCTEKVPKYIIDSELFVYKELQLGDKGEFPTVASNWLISAYANNDIVVATQMLLFEYWRKEKKLENYYIFHLFFKIVTEIFKEQWKKVPVFSNIPPHILRRELLEEFDEERFNQIKTMSPIHKLNREIENKDTEKYTFYDYIISNNKK